MLNPKFTQLEEHFRIKREAPVLWDNYKRKGFERNCHSRCSPWLLEEEFADEVLAVVGDVTEGVSVEAPVTAPHVVQRLRVVLPGEGRQSAQPARNNVKREAHTKTRKRSRCTVWHIC